MSDINILYVLKCVLLCIQFHTFYCWYCGIIYTVDNYGTTYVMYCVWCVLQDNYGKPKMEHLLAEATAFSKLAATSESDALIGIFLGMCYLVMRLSTQQWYCYAYWRRYESCEET